MKRNSGIFLFSGKEFLILHRTGKNSITWSLPMGTIHDDGDGVSVVEKKLMQLANVDRKKYGIIKYLGEAKNPYGNMSFTGHYSSLTKRTHGLELMCNYMVTDSSSGEEFPAIDDYMWVTKEGARKLIPPYQLKLLEKLPDA
jgi:predicted NUDIX family NTP pyrophosphohydrolase